MDLKEAINELKEWVEVDRRTRKNEVESDFDIFCENKNVAIEIILQKLDNLQKENEELKKGNEVIDRFPLVRTVKR